MQDFVYAPQCGRVVFGRGRLATLAQEVDRLGAEKVLVLTTPGQLALGQACAELLGPRFAASFPGAAMHTPVNVTEQAMILVAEAGVDAIVAIGGGSTIGLAKAIALRTDLPQIAVPTTYAGSEMTPILGETRDGIKATQVSQKVLPEVVIYDVDLTLALPASVSGTSGMNAIAHAVEALYARDRNPVTDMMAGEGISRLMAALPVIAREPADLNARANAQYGAWLCAMCLGAVGMALHHKLCHTLGGSFALPHAETHTVVLPHALAYNAPNISGAMAVLRTATGSDDPAMALYELAGALSVPRALGEIGMAHGDIDAVVNLALANPYWNPRPVEPDRLRAMLERAWAGAPPLQE